MIYSKYVFIEQKEKRSINTFQKKVQSSHTHPHTVRWKQDRESTELAQSTIQHTQRFLCRLLHILLYENEF